MEHLEFQGREKELQEGLPSRGEEHSEEATFTVWLNVLYIWCVCVCCAYSTELMKLSCE